MHFFALLTLTGCTNPMKKVDANAWAENYYKFNSGQNRACDLIHLKGKGMSITLTNVDELKVSTQLPQVSMIPKEASFWESLNLSELLLGYGLYKVALNGPTVVTQKEPLIVQPEIITK
jgi:hypothetical protein